VDDRELLHHALPFPVFFANFCTRPTNWKSGPAFLSPPASRPPAAAANRLDFLRPPLSIGHIVVQDLCNGLVLCLQELWYGPTTAGFVCNPMTERWARLPDPPTGWPRGHDGLFLAFDPAVSPHYEAFLLPVPPPPQRDDGWTRAPPTLGMYVPQWFFEKWEEPAVKAGKLLPLLVFSSETGRWRRQLFAPGRCFPPCLYDRVTQRRGQDQEKAGAWAPTWRSAVYSRGALYARCRKRVLLVLWCAEGTYDMVQVPSPDAGAADHILSRLPACSIFRSAGDDGTLLRYARVDACRVKAWALRESGDGEGQLAWTMTHDADLAAHARMLPLLHDAPSNLLAANATLWSGAGGVGKCAYFPDEDREDVEDGAALRRWNWDEASLLDMEVGENEVLGDGDAAGAPSPFAILGCHPSQDVVYLASGALHVVAYHLGSGKVQ
jgi:hypothetical protein